MCKQGKIEKVEVIVPFWYSDSGSQETRIVGVDRCIAEIIEALNKGGIATVASCCGHQIKPGRITFRNGRELMVFNNQFEIEKAYMAIQKYQEDEKKEIEK